MKHLIGIGHSHLHAISEALREITAAQPGLLRYTPMCFLDPPFRDPFYTENGKECPSAAFLSALEENLTKGDDVSVFLYLGGSEHLRWGVTPGPRPFDFIDPFDDDGMAPVGQLIPFELFMAFARDSARYMNPVVKLVRSIATLPLVQFLAPPPPRDMPALVALDAELLQQIGPFAVSSVPFRVKVWRAAARALEATCEELDVACLRPPPEVVDADGCLRDAFVSDVLHGNLAWGRLQVRQLLQHVGIELERV